MKTTLPPSDRHSGAARRLLPAFHIVGCGLLLLAIAFLWRPGPAMAQEDELPLEVAFIIPEDTPHARSVVWGDMDGDGDLDLAFGSSNQKTQVFRNDGTGRFDLAWQAPEPSNTYGVAWGDYDGDGDLDLAVGNLWQTNQVYRNDGTGSFDLVWELDTDNNAARAIAWGDYDGDGDLDLAIGNTGRANEVYRNKGDGSLEMAWQSGDMANTWSVAWGDLDGDGDLDLAVGNEDEPNQVFRNDTPRGGIPNFVLVWESTDDVRATHSLAWGDYDGDGDPDLAIGNWHSPNQVLRNDGPLAGTGPDWSFSQAWESDSEAAVHTTHSIAWADMDGDGHLDLVAGNGDAGAGAHNNQPNQVFRNDGAGAFSLVWSSVEYLTTAVAPGDMDGDGDLDLAVANFGSPCEIYRNEASANRAFVPGWISNAGGGIKGVAWGDYDGDGDLDLVVGQTNIIRTYQNDGTGAFSLDHDINTLGVTARAVAWADYDGDGDLDLAVGNLSEAAGADPNVINQIYQNDGQGILTPSNFGAANFTYNIEWADFDRDGDLDLAVGNRDQPNQVYRNDTPQGADQPPAFALAWEAPVITTGTDLDWGDYDGDGDPDLVVGNDGQPNQVFRNDGPAAAGGGWTFTLAWEAPETHRTMGLAWGDYDGDGDLDLIVGNAGFCHEIYANDGAGTLTLAWLSSDAKGTATILPADYDGDGDLDFAAGTWAHGVQLYRNLGDGIFTTIAIKEAVVVRSLAWGDADGDGDLDLALGYPGVPVYINTRLGGQDLPDNAPQVTVARPGGTPQADFYSTPAILESNLIPIAYTLSDPEGQPVGQIRASYSLNGGGQWFPAIPDSSTQTSHLETGRITPVQHTFVWDTFASGFFGQSDNVLFRLEAYPVPAQPGDPGTYLYLNGTAGSQPWSHSFAATFPFRVRGTQVRVLSGGEPAEGALVYRLPAGKSTGGFPITDTAGRPYRTGIDGYLPGRGQIGVGDSLLALLPVEDAEAHKLYHISGVPAATGVAAHTVVEPGVQNLVVSADHPLLLFDLDVSLEWDAHNDTFYLDQLVFNLERASQYLYDFSNGQLALGTLHLYQNADEWPYSHVVVQANNRLRPYAAQGGVVSADTVDPDHDLPEDTIVYGPGQVTMGSTWNRYGNPGQSLGEDWPLILAHELSHYLLFHDDVYLGLEDGVLTAVDTCLGSAMGDLYSGAGNTEFIADDPYWQANCSTTLAAQTLGRNEWQTMQLWYPALVTPATINPGPSLMPFDFTTVQIHQPYTPTNTLADPTFYADYEGGGGSSSEARAYLLRDQYVIDLGGPFGGQNRVIARGAAAGDRLCVFDRARAQFGCEVIESGDDRLAMRLDPTWNPIIQFRPVNSQTLGIEVTSEELNELALRARIFPNLGFAEEPIALERIAGVYSGTLTLTHPALSGNVQLWVEEEASEDLPRRETIIAYSIGGDPGTMRAAGGTMRAGGGTMRAAGGTMRAGGGTMRAAGAPILSPDGQMIFFTENPMDFAPKTFFTVQGMAGLPLLPPGRTLVGQGYNIVASPGITLPNGSVSIQYLSNDVLVAGADEQDLRLYFYDGAAWQELDTEVNTYFNLATAPSRGEGIYALMATIEIQLYGRRWNLIGYPVREARPVVEALRSIDGYYTLVKGYDASDPTDPWKIYNVLAPAHVNDLEMLEYAHGYYVWVTEDVTLYLAGARPDTAPAAFPDLPPPPATYYGPLLSGAAFAPTPGTTVTALVGGQPCGQALALEVDGQVVYAVDVVDERERAGCGAPGKQVTFRVGSQKMDTSVPWDSAWVDELAVSPAAGGPVIHLPIIAKH